MKITELRIFRLEAPLSKPFAYSRGWIDKRQSVLIQIETDAGVSGWGEAFGPGKMSAGALDLIRPMIIGADPFETEKIWHDVYGFYRDHGQKGPLVDALSAVDIACWDIKGKALKQPICRLMGGPLRAEVPAYASGLFRTQSDFNETVLAEEAAGYAEQGYSAVKLKVGFGIKYDLRAVRTVRNAVGPSVQVMIDANGAYDAVNALQLARCIEEFDITWFEEPVPPEDTDGYRRLREAQSIPLAGGEAEFTRFGFRELLTKKIVDYIQPDICAAGGFSECKIIASMAHAFGVRTSPHTWGSAISIAASLHLLAVIPDIANSIHLIPPMLEFDCTEHGVRAATMHDSLQPRRGVARIPEAPGLGIEIDADKLRPLII